MRCATLLLLATIACSRPRVHSVATIEESEVPLLSIIRVGDPVADPQFASGFYPAEPGGWCWTRKHFTTVLVAPQDWATHGATLELLYDVPDVVLRRLGPVTLTATIGGVQLQPEIRGLSGPQPYRAPVPPEAFSAREVLVEFSLDKVIEPNTVPGEDRELGVAVYTAALLPKASAP